MLNINRGLGLSDETDQAKYQKDRCDHIFPASSLFCALRWVLTPNIRMVQHRSAFNVAIRMETGIG